MLGGSAVRQLSDRERNSYSRIHSLFHYYTCLNFITTNKFEMNNLMTNKKSRLMDVPALVAVSQNER